MNKMSTPRIQFCNKSVAVLAREPIDELPLAELEQCDLMN